MNKYLTAYLAYITIGLICIFVIGNGITDEDLNTKSNTENVDFYKSELSRNRNKNDDDLYGDDDEYNDFSDGYDNKYKSNINSISRKKQFSCNYTIDCGHGKCQEYDRDVNICVCDKGYTTRNESRVCNYEERSTVTTFLLFEI